MAGVVRTAEEAARRLRYRNAWQRAKRAANRAAALCYDCGKACSAPTTRRGFCADCAAKMVRRETEKRAAARAAKEEARRAASLAPDAPVCPHCDGRDLMRGGTSASGTQRFRCRGCGRWSYGKTVTPPVNTTPCPYCRGRCVKTGFAPPHRRRGKRLRRTGLQRYLCTGCGRKNTDMYPWRKQESFSPFPFLHTFYFGVTEHQKLMEYCRESREGINRAVREIFREAAYRVPGCGWASARRVYDAFGDYTVVVDSPPRRRDPQIDAAMVAARFQDIRAESMRARMTRTGHRKYAPTILLSLKLSIALDVVAKEGLVRTMRSRGLNHQEAARFLVRSATRPPGPTD